MFMNCNKIREALIIYLIQDSEADFLWKVSLKILNSGISWQLSPMPELSLLAYTNNYRFCWRLGVTIVAKNDYCDSIDIAGSAIEILLLLWTTIAILLSDIGGN